MLLLLRNPQTHDVNNKIYRFKCRRERSIETELKNRLLYSDKIGNTTTYLILDENDDK